MNKRKITVILFTVFLIIGMMGLPTVQAEPSVPVNTNAVPAVIDVGVMSPLTGDLESVGPGIVDGAIAAAYEINNSADFDFDIHLLIEDSQGTETGAGPAYSNLHAAGVQLIIGAAASSASTVVATNAKDDHIVQISYASTAATLSDPQYDYFFRTVPTDALQAEALAALIDDLGYNNTVIVNRADDYGTGFATGLKLEFEALGGIVSDTISYPADTTDFAATVTSIKTATAAECIALIAFITDGGAFITECRAAGVYLPIFGTDGIADASLADPEETTPTIVADSHLVTGTQPHQAAAGEGKYDDFIASLEDVVDAGLSYVSLADGGKTPTIFADFAYDAMFVGAHAVKLADEYVGATIKGKVAEAGAAYVGATGNKTFSAVGDPAQSSYDIFQFQEGVVKTVGSWTASDGVTYATDFITPAAWEPKAAPGFEAVPAILAVFACGFALITLRKRRR